MTSHPPQAPGFPAAVQQPTFFGAPPAQEPPLLRRSPMGLGDIIGVTWQVLRRRFGLLLGISLVSGLVAGLLALLPAIALLTAGVFGAMAAIGSPPDGPPLGDFWVLLPLVVICCALIGVIWVWVWAKFNSMLVAVIDQLARGFQPTWDSATAQAQGTDRRALPLLWWGAGLGALAGAIPVGLLLVALESDQWGDGPTTVFALTVLALPVLSLVMLYPLARLVYLLPVLTLEKMSGWQAVRRAWRLTSGQVGRTLGLLVVGCGVPYAANLALNVARVELQERQALAGLGGLVSLVTAVLGIALGVWLTAWQTVMYLDRVQMGDVTPAQTEAAWPSAPAVTHCLPGPTTAQYPPTQYPPAQYPPAQYPPAQFPPTVPHPGQPATPAVPTPQPPGYAAPQNPPPGPAWPSEDPTTSPWARRDDEGL
ncbi:MULTISPECIES: hypothetical protein [unclassified Luteococcus]|uniref:hypothetical protein n=1 Tax=unclassified Luteococcus TaxID=2639923 RepID=UPI00313AB95D